MGETHMKRFEEITRSAIIITAIGLVIYWILYAISF